MAPPPRRVPPPLPWCRPRPLPPPPPFLPPPVPPHRIPLSTQSPPPPLLSLVSPRASVTPMVVPMSGAEVGRSPPKPSHNRRTMSRTEMGRALARASQAEAPSLLHKNEAPRWTHRPPQPSLCIQPPTPIGWRPPVRDRAVGGECKAEHHCSPTDRPRRLRLQAGLRAAWRPRTSQQQQRQWCPPLRVSHPVVTTVGG